MGGEAAHGMLILSPRAVERLESYTPPWPMPKIFRLTKGGKLIEGSSWARRSTRRPCWPWRITCWRSTGRSPSAGLPELMARADRNAQAVFDFCDGRDWIDNLAADPATRSNTSVCLKFTDPGSRTARPFAKAVAKRLEAEGVALDIGGYRDAPPGLGSGADRRWRPRTSRRCCPGSTGRSTPRSRLRRRPPEGEAGTSRPGLNPEKFTTRRTGTSPGHPQKDAKPMAPKVLISDKLSDAAVQIFAIAASTSPSIPPSARTRTSS
jgi:hypothetical protein